MLASLFAASCPCWKLRLIKLVVLVSLVASVCFSYSLSRSGEHSEAEDVSLHAAPIVSNQDAPHETLLTKEAASASGSSFSWLHGAHEQKIELRGSVLFNRNLLTEGPARHAHAGNARENWDSSEIYFASNVAGPERNYIIGWRPIVNTHKCPNGSKVELVHHMNVWGLEDRVAQQVFREDSKMIVGQFPADLFETGRGRPRHSQRMLASYDRGAGEYRLPPGYGIPIGRGTPNHQLLLEYHLLKPHCWSGTDYKAQETSGFELFVTSKRPKHIAALVGFTDESMRIEPQKGVMEHVTVLKPKSLEQVFVGPHNKLLRAESDFSMLDAGASKDVELLAVHLHTHDLTQAKHFEVKNPDGTTFFQSKEEPGGYGKAQQSMINLKTKGWPRIVLQPGQSLQVHCKYDTDSLAHVVTDGTSWGEEMCSGLFVVGGYGHEHVERLPGTELSVSGGWLVQLSRRLLWLMSPSQW